jgi:ribose/xylose/arabinose/galactoside ABC-type transport system permease subunit
VLALGVGLLGISLVQWHWPLCAAIALCVASGALCGLLNGFLTIRFRLPSFIVTLGLMEAARGATYCAQLSAADPNSGNGFELAAIAAVVIGGTSLMGGRGSVINSLFGVLVIAVLETGLAQVGAQESAKRMVTGAVIIIAVIVDFYRTRRAEAKSRAG